MSNHFVPTRALKDEATFYQDTHRTYDHLTDFKRRVIRQNREFNALLQYYQQNEGRLDFGTLIDADGGLLPHKPNLGTDHESWYYLDERGNKIWVQNMRLDTTSDAAKSGAFESSKHADGKVVVVKVPTHKKSYCLQPDYRKKCVEFDNYRRLQTQGKPTAGCQQVASSFTNSQSEPHQDANSYIRSQSSLASKLQHHGTHGPELIFSHSGQYVYRPPTSVEEAEARLKELRVEEELLLRSVNSSI